MADDKKTPGDRPTSSVAPSSAHTATRRTISGMHPIPTRQATSAELKPTIAEALRETADAVQEAVRELTGKTHIGAPVAIVQPTAEQIRAADAASAAPGQSAPGTGAPGAPPGSAAPPVAAARAAGAAASTTTPPGPSGPGAVPIPAGVPTPGLSATPPVSSTATLGAPVVAAVSPALVVPPAMADKPPRSTELVTVKIDGRDVKVPKGTNLLEACLQNDVDVSYFCYHPGLSSPAVCRQCLVEIVGQPKLAPSCYTPVSDGMQVVTNTPRVTQARAQMLEFTLVNHPVDCPICDKAGECTLQKLYMDWDGVASRTNVEKVHKPKAVDLGPTIVLDAERCILCTRCIRVCDEVAGQHQLEMTYRGDHETLSVAKGQALDNPYSLNTVDVCPVGALTSKDFRFRMRAWELYTVPSVCPGCATGCNVEVHHHQGEVWRLVPRENQAVNKFWMCDEGRFTYHELRSRRIAGARIGQGRGLPGQVASIDKAASYAAQRLVKAKDGGGAIGLVFGAQAQNEALYALSRVAELLRGGGAQVTCYVAGRAARPERADRILRSADVNPNTAGAERLAEGAGSFAALQADLLAGKLKALWLVGEDLPLPDSALPTFLPLLDKLDLLIVQAVHDSPVTQRAQVILPAAAWAEVDGTFTNNKGMLQRVRRAVTPPGDARSHLELVAALAHKAGLATGQPWQGPAKQVFQHMLGSLTAVQGVAAADWGRELPPLQLRFAHSRG